MLNPFWGPADSRSFTKGSINISFVHMGHGVGTVRNPAADKWGGFHFRGPRTKQVGSHCARVGSVENRSSFSQHPLCPFLDFCFSRREVERQLGSLLPKAVCSQGMPGSCRAKVATAPGYLASKWRKTRGEDRPKESDFPCSRSSVAAATTVPACVGVLTVPKLGPPAQYLIGAVLPTATRHAWGRVIDFKLQCLSEELIGAMIVFEYS